MKLFFVCTGNANRSALAEVIMKKLLNQHHISGVEAISCGIKVPQGLMRDKIMCQIAKQHGYEMGGPAIQMNDEINNADIILAMTEHQKNEITRTLTYSHWNRIFLFNEYCFGEVSDVMDPYFQSEYIYRKCFDRIKSGCERIIDRLIKQFNLSV